jgi:hypothetical protein
MEEILKIVSIVLGVLSGTIIPFIIATVKNVKAKNALAFINETAKFVNELVVEYETKFWDIAKTAKMAGLTIGGFKKEMVMSALRERFADGHMVFDATYWSNYIDEYVSESRKINTAIKTNVVNTPAA